MKTIFGILGMLLLIATIGIAVGEIDYDAMEMISEDTLEDQSNGIYRVDVDISASRVLIDYRTDIYSEDEIIEDVGAVIGAYAYIVQYYNGDVGDLIAKIRAPNGELVGTYTCKNEWVEKLDPNDQEMMVDIFLKVARTIKT